MQHYAESTGQAKITYAYNLPSRYIIHTVGPVICGKLTEHDCCLLASCYRSCLELAAQSSLKSIAFCCISTGEFRFPNEKAAEIAVDTVKEFRKQASSVKKVEFPNGSGNSFPRTITKSAPQGKSSFVEKAQPSGFFDSLSPTFHR